MRRAVFLDRDGILNHSEVREGRPYAPQSLEDFVLLPGVTESAALLRQAGFLLVVVTNQPDVASGTVSQEVVEAMHHNLRAWLPIDEVKVCYHSESDGCACRKPKPGLLLAAAREWSIDLAASYMIGDRWRDVGAGQAAGCRTILVDYHYAEALREKPDFVVASLSEAVQVVLQTQSQSVGFARSRHVL